MYPHGHSIPVEVYNELNGILMFACTGRHDAPTIFSYA